MPEDLGFRRLLFLATGVLGTAFLPSWVILLRQSCDCEIRFATTASARKFVTPTVLSAISGNPVSGPDWQEDQSTGVEHLLLANWAEVVIVFPASLNFCARVANGLTDDIPTAVVATTEAPVVLAPSVAATSLEKAGYRKVIDELREQGLHVIDPVLGLSVTTGRHEGGSPAPFGMLMRTVRNLSARSSTPRADGVGRPEGKGANSVRQTNYLCRGPRFNVRRIQERDVTVIQGWLTNAELRPESIATDLEEAQQVDAHVLLNLSEESPEYLNLLALVADDSAGEQVALVNFMVKSSLPTLWEGEILVGRRPDGAKGVGTEIFALAVDVLFSETPAQKLWGPIAADNTPSLRMVRRLGFEREGFLRQHIPMSSGAKDAYLFSVLKDEWRLPFETSKEGHV